jgi:hypothetical protein
LCSLVCGQIASQMSIDVAANAAFISALKTN